MKRIVLASSSSRRSILLNQIGLSFVIRPSELKEKIIHDKNPTTYTRKLSINKAKEVSLKEKNAIIISADTVISIDDEIIGKPKDADEVRKILKSLSARSHYVVTSFSILNSSSGKNVTRTVKTKVYMKEISDIEIDRYIKSSEPFDKAGAYAIQEKGCMFVEKIEGDYFNVVGLPLFSLIKELKGFGIEVIG